MRGIHSVTSWKQGMATLEASSRGEMEGKPISRHFPNMWEQSGRVHRQKSRAAEKQRNRHDHMPKTRMVSFTGHVKTPAATLAVRAAIALLSMEKFAKILQDGQNLGDLRIPYYCLSVCKDEMISPKKGKLN